MSSISTAAVTGRENVQQKVQATDRHEVETKHCEDIEISSGWYDKVPDFVTLVSDRAIPSGYLEQFIALEQQIRAAADRADRIKQNSSRDPLQDKTRSLLKGISGWICWLMFYWLRSLLWKSFFVKTQRLAAFWELGVAMRRYERMCGQFGSFWFGLRQLIN